MTTKGGSEESGSSSSQSSIDLDDGEEEDQRNKDERASGKSCLKFVGDRLLQHSNDVSSIEPNLVWETRRSFNVNSRVSHIPPIHKTAHNMDGEPIRTASKLLNTDKAISSHCQSKASNMNSNKEPVDGQSLIKCNNSQQGDTINPTKDTVNNEIPITSKSKEEKSNVVRTTVPETEICNGTFKINNQGNTVMCREGNYGNILQEIKQTERKMNDSCFEGTQVDIPVPYRENLKMTTSTAADRTQLFSPAVNLPQSDMDPRRDKKVLKAVKPLQTKERTSKNCAQRANVQTYQQSFNTVAHKDQSILNRNKSKSNPKYITQVKDKTRKSPEPITSGETAVKVKPKLRSVKGAHCNTGISSPRKKVIAHAQSKRANPDKLSSNRAQQQQPVRELKSIRQLKRPNQIGTPRSKSAVDFITYKDMFQQIQSGDEGPAIYEMFAGPIYDNLRVCSSCDTVQGRQVQSAKVKHKPVKQAHSKLRRSPGERMVVSAKGKPKLASFRGESVLTSVSRKGPHKTKDIPKLDGHTEAELVQTKDVTICHNRAQEKAKDHMLSIIEEVLSKHESETLKSDKTFPTTANSCNAEDKSHDHMNMQGKNWKSSIGNPSRPVPEAGLSQSPQQLKINTWTSSSGNSHTMMSPVYQKFLDEVGDGPLTDDLLQCLAEELISLDERDISISPCPENLQLSKEKSNKEDDRTSGRNALPEVNCCHFYRFVIKTNLFMDDLCG